MLEGEILQQYIDKQRLRKQKIADDLGVTRTTLYQYFKTQVLTPETKEKFETYFGEPIFSNAAQEPDATYQRTRHLKKLSSDRKRAIPFYD